MPAKLVPRENSNIRSSVFYRPYNLPELNNNSAAFLEISNHHNFVDFLYVFENRRPLNPSPPARIEFMHEIFDNESGTTETAKSVSSTGDQLKPKRSDRTGSERMKDERSIRSDLMNEQFSENNENKVFSPAFLNGKNYKPICGHHHSSKLYNGSRFVGHQKTKSNSYEVEVIIQHVDFENSFICGNFKINGLTEEYPQLTTFFDGQIIDGERYQFLTRKFDATREVDKSHWAKLIPGINRKPKQFALMFDDEYDYSKLRNSEYVFMRWKERHLVKDYKVKQMVGCSYDGFYYILYHKKLGSIEGFYYHQQSEDFQSLSLKHAEDLTSKIYEIR